MLELARISSEIENILGLTENRKKQPNHSLNTPALEGQEKAIEKLHKILKQCRIFYSEELHMFKLMSKEIVPVLWMTGYAEIPTYGKNEQVKISYLEFY